MLTLPDAIVPVLNPFATLFRSPTWRKAQILLVGAILAPGQRTVAAALRVMGLSDDRNYARYHQVLNRAVWSPREAARILLLLLLQHLDQGDGPLIFGIDETLERRRWLPQRSLVLVGDGGYAVLDLLHCCQSLAQPVTLIARLRLDAALYEPAPPRQRGQPSASAERPTAARADGTPGLAHRVMGRGVGSLVQRHYPHGGTHLANGGLVPLGQATRAHPLGLGSGPPG